MELAINFETEEIQQNFAAWPYYEINTRMKYFLFLWWICPLFLPSYSPLPASSSTFFCSYSSFSYICCPLFNLFLPPPSHTRLHPSLHLFLTILLRTLPPRSHFLFFLSSPSFLPAALLFPRQNIWERWRWVGWMRGKPSIIHLSLCEHAWVFT